MKNIKIFLAVDIGGTFTKFGIFSEEGKLLKHWKSITNIKENHKIYQEISKEFLKVIKENNYIPLAMGVGIPGFPDKYGKVVFSGNIGWKNYEIKKDFMKHFDIPIVVENDVNMHTLGEKAVGKAKDSKNFVLLALGTGLGSGIFINNELYLGNSGFAGEVGHIPLQNIMECSCGLPNCAEPVFSATGLINFYNKHLKDHQIDVKGVAQINGAYINSLAKQGDKIALKAINDLAKYGGKVCATLAMTLNPEKIILAGGITTNNSFLLEKINIEYKKLVHNFISDSTVIEISDTGNDAALYGCLYSAQKELGKVSSHG